MTEMSPEATAQALFDDLVQSRAEHLIDVHRGRVPILMYYTHGQIRLTHHTSEEGGTAVPEALSPEQAVDFLAPEEAPSEQVTQVATALGSIIQHDLAVNGDRYREESERTRSRIFPVPLTDLEFEDRERLEQILLEQAQSLDSEGTLSIDPDKVARVNAFMQRIPSRESPDVTTQEEDSMLHQKLLPDSPELAAHLARGVDQRMTEILNKRHEATIPPEALDYKGSQSLLRSEIERTQAMREAIFKYGATVIAEDEVDEHRARGLIVLEDHGMMLVPLFQFDDKGNILPKVKEEHDRFLEKGKPLSWNAAGAWVWRGPTWDERPSRLERLKAES